MSELTNTELIRLEEQTRDGGEYFEDLLQLALKKSQQLGASKNGKAIVTNSIAKIPLGGKNAGIYFTVDRSYAYLDSLCWYIAGNSSKQFGYVTTKYKGTGVRLHHMLLCKPANGFVVDHISRDVLDNRVCNLRVCTSLENNRNASPRKNAFSKFKGVGYKKQTKKWYAGIRFNGKKVHIGYFDTELEAAFAYDNACKKLFSEYAVTNGVKL